jgi:transposase-like protein
MPSGRIKGGKNKCWTKEEKEKIVLYHLNNDIGMDKCAKKFGISRGQMYKWVTSYRENGIEGLINKKKPGNPLSKYYNKKKLSKEEQLEYENMKLRIENELLKKGFLMKGDGTIVKFMK